MINRFQRMLNPYAGFLGGDSGGGGGGGGGSTVSDAEFEGAISQDEANKASGGGGVSYGNSGYVGSGGSSADSGGQAAPVTYKAADGSVHTTEASRNARNEEIAFQAEFDAAIAAGQELNNAYNGNAVSVTSSGMGNITYNVKDPYSGETVTVDNRASADKELDSMFDRFASGLVGDAFSTAELDNYNSQAWTDYTRELGNDEGLFNEAFDRSIKYNQAMERLGGQTENIDIIKEGSIGDKGLFNFVTDFFTGNPEESDIAKTFAADDFADLALGTAYSVTGPEGAEQLNIVNSAGIDKDIALMLDYTGYSDKFDVEDLSSLVQQKNVTEDFNLTNSAGFESLLVKANSALDKGSDYFGLFGQKPDLAYKTFDIVKDGKVEQIDQVVATDEVSLTNMIGQAGAFLAGKLAGSLGAQVVGDLTYSLTGQPIAAALGAATTDAVMPYVAPFGVTTYVDGTGKQFVETTAFGNTRAVAVDDLFTNVTQANEAVNNSIESGDFDINQSLSVGLGNSSYESSIGSDSATSPTNPNSPAATTNSGNKVDWRDLYDPWDGWSAKDIIGEVATNGINLAKTEFATKAPELYKAAQFTAAVNAGANPLEAAVSLYGDKLVEALPEGYENPTEAAVRIAAGENRVDALAGVYGEDLGLDNPLGKAGVESLSIYDKTGDVNEAAKQGVVTYFKEGGELTDVDLALPDYFGESLDVDLGSIDFSGVNLPDLGVDLSGVEDGLKTMYDKFQGALPTISFEGVKFADLGDVDIPNFLEYLPEGKLPEFDFKGVNFYDLGDVDLPEIADLGINIPDLNFDGVDVSDLGVDVGEAVDLGVDFKDLKLGDLDLNVALAIGATGEQQQQDAKDEEVIDPFADTTEEEDTVASKTPLSQVLVKTAV